MSLFPRENVVGTFRGFSQGGLEFHADLVLPYRNEFQSSPMHGLFVVVQLEHDNEAVLGRITQIAAEGRLVSSAGEDYAVRAVREDRPIPEDLRDQYLKYKINIRILGVVRRDGDKLPFVASHRRLPHVGAKVAFLSDELLREVAGHNITDAAELGFLAFGEFIYAQGDLRLRHEDWMQVRAPTVVPRFPVSHLVSRRSFVFARAGFGKSNLNKLLFSNLYQRDPTVPKRGGRRVGVGTVIFDPDGEYFWPDDKGRPGLCDVPHLEDRLVVFTNRNHDSAFYRSFIAGGVRLDIRDLSPAKVLGIALSPERQDQQNVRKLKSLRDPDWRRLVDAVHVHRNNTDPDLFRQLLHLDRSQDAELYAARANLSEVVRMLHDPASSMLRMLLAALADGKLCVVDISQMRGPQGLALSGIILNHIFEHNQVQFTEADSKTIPTVAVIEEAQAVLGGGAMAVDNPFVSWVKEGRKYDLGCVLVTQQPGSIPQELLSQGDNFFVFHLLSAGDLQALKRANAHFSDDLLSSLLNEPLPGNGVFWSSASTEGTAKAYPIPVRVLSFEQAHAPRGMDRASDPVDNYASHLRHTYETAVQAAVAGARVSDVTDAEAEVATEPGDRDPTDVGVVRNLDPSHAIRQAAIDALADNATIWRRAASSDGVPWMEIQTFLASTLPGEVVGSLVPDPNDWAFKLVGPALTEVVGENGWRREKKPSKANPERLVTYVWVSDSAPPQDQSDIPGASGEPQLFDRDPGLQEH
jgi:uncharacterized protein